MKKPLPTGAIARARALRRQPTEAEKRLWWALRDQLPGHHFRRQVPLGRYVADFCCHSERLIVEGDAERTAFLENEGYRVIRFWSNDALSRTEDIVAAIWSALRGPHPHLTSPIKGKGLGGTMQEDRLTPPGRAART